MTLAEFDAEAWIERVAQLLPPLAQAQEPYLREYQERYARVIDVRDGKPPPFPLEDLRLLYDEVRNARLWGMESHYAPLRALLDPVRHALQGHPTLERVAVTGRLIGDNRFSMEIPGSGGDIYTGTLIAGLMARAAEMPDDGLRTSLRELSEFLSPAGNGAAALALGSLDVGCDVFLFYGLALSERIEVADGMVLLPYGELLRFVDEEFVKELAPRGAGFHGWRSVGAIVRPFRWRPVFRRRGSVNDPMTRSPGSFFPNAATFLDLLAVSHAVPVVPLATLSDEIDRSARRLLGRAEWSPGFYPPHSREDPMTAQTLPDNPNFCFVPSYDVEDEVQQIRIVIEGMSGHVPTASIALTIDDALSICDKLNRRLGYDRETWTAMVAASMHVEDDDPDGGAWHRT